MEDFTIVFFCTSLRLAWALVSPAMQQVDVVYEFDDDEDLPGGCQHAIPHLCSTPGKLGMLKP